MCSIQEKNIFYWSLSYLLSFWYKKEEEIQCKSVDKGIQNVRRESMNLDFFIEISSKWFFPHNKASGLWKYIFKGNFTSLLVHVVWQNNTCHFGFSFFHLINVISNLNFCKFMIEIILHCSTCFFMEFSTCSFFIYRYGAACSLYLYIHSSTCWSFCILASSFYISS